MAQPWGVSAIENTSEPNKTHGSVAHRIGEHIKNTVTPESAAETRKRDQRLEVEHSVAPAERAKAFDPEHHVGGTNLTVAQGVHGEARK